MFYDAYREQACLQDFPKIECCRTNFVLKIALINQNYPINARCSAYWKLAGGRSKMARLLLLSMWEFSSREDIHLSWPQASQIISLKRHWPNITASVSGIQGWQDSTRKMLPRLFLLRRHFLLPSDTPGASLTDQNQTCFSLLCNKLSVLQLNSIWAISTRDFVTLDSGEDRRERGRKWGREDVRQPDRLALCEF